MEHPIDLRTREQREAYCTSKHYLGPLCKRLHDSGNGQSWRHVGHGNCVECTRQGARDWRAANLDRAKANTRHRDKKRASIPNTERRKKWPITLHIASTRATAKIKGLPFSLTVDYLKALWIAQGGECFWTGRALSFVDGPKRAPFRPSVDKLDPALGYVVGNVVWASNFANRARSDYPAKDFAVLMVELGFVGAFMVDPRTS